MELYNGDCLEIMKDLSNNSIDLLFCDLPYGQTSCKWDCLIDLDLFWKQINRICKDGCPMFFTCSTKFGVSLINSNPKNFRYDLVWVKSTPCGFLNAKKMPMKKHEMVYVFYNKLPKVYTENIAEHHTHKFIKETTDKFMISDMYGNGGKDTANKSERKHKILYKKSEYDPPLPTSVIKDENLYIRGKETNSNNEDVYDANDRMKNGKLYHHARSKQKGDEAIYDPPLPTSVIKTERNTLYGNVEIPSFSTTIRASTYEPPLPNSILEIASQKGKHATQKPVDLIKWCLKYYSKEGDVVLDPTMGSGSTGVACEDMNRYFIGVEIDEVIFKVACDRLKIEEQIND